MLNPKTYPLLAVAGTFLLAMAVGAAVPAQSAPSTTPASAPAVGTEIGERTVEDGGTGAYKAIQVGDTSLPTHSIYRPKDLSAFGDKVKLPILAWGNGGCANSSNGHQNYLSEIASHGFLVVAIGPMPTGGGRGGMGGGGGTKSSQLLDAVNWAIAQNQNKDSRYFGKIDTTKIGVFGHSCGGLQALEVSLDPRITTTIVVDSGVLNDGGGAGRGPGRGAPATAPAGAMGPTSDNEQLIFVGAPAAGAGAPGGMPGRGMGRGPGGGMGGGMPGGMGRGPGGGMPGGRGGAGGGMAGMPALTKNDLTKLHAPVFYLLGGESDIAYANGMDDFKRIEKLPVFVANKGVGHGGTFTALASLAWFKWQLKGDAEAGKLFTGNPCELSKKEGWTVDKKNIP
jgi:hypothetical protein